MAEKEFDLDEIDKYHKFRDEVFEINLKKVRGEKLSSGDYKKLKLWKDLQNF